MLGFIDQYSTFGPILKELFHFFLDGLERGKAIDMASNYNEFDVMHFFYPSESFSAMETAQDRNGDRNAIAVEFPRWRVEYNLESSVSCFQNSLQTLRCCPQT